MYSYVIIITPKYYGKPSTLNIIFYNKFVIVSIELNFILFCYLQDLHIQKHYLTHYHQRKTSLES